MAALPALVTTTEGVVPIEHTYVHNREPRVKSRPRRGQGRTYTERNVVVEEQHIKEGYDGPLFTGPVEMTVRLYPDKSVIRIKDCSKDRHKLRGDVDNYLKLIQDGLNEVAFVDDKQVVKVTIEKAAVA